MLKNQFLKHYWQVASKIQDCISVKQYSKDNHISSPHVRKLLKHGRIKGIKINRRWYILPNPKR